MMSANKSGQNKKTITVRLNVKHGLSAMGTDILSVSCPEVPKLHHENMTSLE